MKRSMGLATVFFLLATPLPLCGSTAPIFPNALKYRDAGAQPASARAGSAMLKVRALRGQSKTDVEVTSARLDGTPAGELQKVQVKFFGSQQQVLVNDNYRKDALQGGSATFTYDSAYRGERLQVQANVGGIDGARTDVVTVDAAVVLRPDLAVLNVQAPAQAYTNQNVTITALVAERNLDTGARANCNLTVDGVLADSATGIWVDAGDSVTCEFTHVFTSTGVKKLSVDVTNVDPADYDTGNNHGSAQIEIVDPIVPVVYNLTAKDDVIAGHNGTTTHLAWTAIGGGSSYVYDYTKADDSTTRDVRYDAVLTFDRRVTFPVVVQTSGASDGRTFVSVTVPLNANYSVGGTTCGSSYQTARWFKVCTYRSTTNGQLHEWTDLQTGTRSGSVTFYSSVTTTYLYDTGVKNVYSQNDWSTLNIGYQPTPTLGNHVDIRASVSDASATYDAAASVDLYPVDVTVAPPDSCITWNTLYSTGRSVGYTCTQTSTHTYGKEGSSSGTDRQ